MKIRSGQSNKSQFVDELSVLSLIAHYKQFPPPTYGWRKNDCLTVTAGLTDRPKQSLS